MERWINSEWMTEVASRVRITTITSYGKIRCISG